MRWKKLKVAYFILLIALAISLTFLLIKQTDQPSATKVAQTTTTSFLDHPPATHPQTTTTTTTAPPPTTTTTFQASTSQAASFSDGVWDRLMECEDNDDPAKGPTGWASNTGNGYEGGLQFSFSTWTDYVAQGKPYGLKGYPAHAYDATREQQITVAIRVRDGVDGSSDPFLNAQGWNAWPTCRHEAGV